MDEIIFHGILNDIIHQEAFDLLYGLKTKSISLEKAVNIKLSNYKNESFEIGNPYIKVKSTVLCPTCSQEISGQRFAPHLEKCLKGNKRGCKSTTIQDKPLVLNAPDKKKQMTSTVTLTQDPYPESLIIKINLKNGIPIKNQIRQGCTMEYFLQSKSLQ